MTDRPQTPPDADASDVEAPSKAPPVIGVPAPKQSPANQTKPFRKTGILGYLFLIIAVAVAFGSLLRSDLGWTQFDAVPRSAYTEMSSWTDAWKPDSLKANDPISITSYFLEEQIPMPLHITQRVINLSLHLIAAFLLLKIINRLQFPAALGATLVFALHPACVQAIFWPGYRSELVGLILILSALYFGSGTVSRRDVILFTVIGLISAIVHPAGLCLPLILAGMILFRNDYISLESFNPILPLLFACLFIAMWIEPATPDFPEGMEMSQRMSLIGQTMYFYIRQALMPIELDLFYPISQTAMQRQSGAMGLLPFLLFLPFYGLFLFNIKQRWSRTLIFGLTSFLLLCVYGLAQSGRFINGSLAHEDHALYVALPILVPLIVVGISAASQYGGRSVVILWRICLGIITFGLFSLTTAYTYQISDPIAMWRHMSEVWPNSWQAKAAYVESIKRADSNELSIDDQIVILYSILEENPNLIQQRIELARLYKDAGQFSNALREYRRILRESENDREFLTEAADFFDSMNLSWEANNVRQRLRALPEETQ